MDGLAKLGVSSELLGKAVGSIAVIVCWLAILRLAKRLIARLDDEASRFQVARLLGYAVGVVGLIVLARIWFQGVAGFGTYLGLLSAGIAISLQDPLTNMAGWLFILIRRPFKIGDRIQIGAQMGDVVDIRLFRFVMLEIGNWVHADQSTGRLMHVPNGLVFKTPVANYDEAFGFIWNELEVTLTYESDWRKAKELFLDIVTRDTKEIEPEVRKRIKESAEELHLKFMKLTPVIWTSVVDNGVRLSMRYLCKARQRRVTASKIWEDILDAVNGADDIDLAYSTVRQYQTILPEPKNLSRPQPLEKVPPKLPAED